MWDFELVAIKQTEPPLGSDNGLWYHYIIANRITTVNGYRCGSKDEVTQFIHSTIKRLNSRHLGVGVKQSLSL